VRLQKVHKLGEVVHGEFALLIAVDSTPLIVIDIIGPRLEVARWYQANWPHFAQLKPHPLPRIIWWPERKSSLQLLCATNLFPERWELFMAGKHDEFVRL